MSTAKTKLIIFNKLQHPARSGLFQAKKREVIHNVILDVSQLDTRQRQLLGKAREISLEAETPEELAYLLKYGEVVAKLPSKGYEDLLEITDDFSNTPIGTVTEFGLTYAECNRLIMHMLKV